MSVTHDMSKSEREINKQKLLEAKAMNEQDKSGKNQVHCKGPPLGKENDKNQEKKARKLDGRNIVHSNVNSFNRSSLVCSVFNPQNLHCIYTNADSLLNKIEEFKIRFLSDENISDIIAITEVVPKNMRYTLNNAEIELSGYELFPSNFPGSARRGVIIYM